MAIYLVLSKFQNKRDTGTLKQRAQKVHDATYKELPGSKWSCQYSVEGGDFDLVDVVETDDSAASEKISEIIRSHGQAEAKVLRVTPWKQYLSSL
jgi:uncharacterized protein with GYD domain